MSEWGQPDEPAYEQIRRGLRGQHVAPERQIRRRSLAVCQYAALVLIVAAGALGYLGLVPIWEAVGATAVGAVVSILAERG